MSFSITLDNGEFDMCGWSGLRTQAAAATHIPALEARARAGVARVGADVGEYRIEVAAHGPDCLGGCAHELGLADMCRVVDSRPIGDV